MWNKSLAQIPPLTQRFIAKAVGSRIMLKALFFLLILKRYCMAVAPGEINLHENCPRSKLCVCVYACKTRTTSISSILWGFSSNRITSNYNGPFTVIATSFIWL